MLRETPIFRERVRKINGRTYIDWCAYCGTFGGKPIRIYAKTKHEAKVKASCFLSMYKCNPVAQILNRQKLLDAANALEYLLGNGFEEQTLTQLAFDFVRREKISGKINYRNITLGEMLKLFLSRIKDSQKRSLQSYNTAINNLLKSISETKPLNEISREEISKHLSKFPSIITYNSNHARLRYIFNWCVDEGILEQSPMRNLKPKPVPYHEPVYFLPEKVEAIMRLIEKNPPDADGALFFIFGFFCGIRTAEIMRLEWRDINLEEGYVRIRQPKGFSRGVKPRLVELEPNAKAWIKGYYTPQKSGKIITSRLSEWKKQILQPLGLGWGNDRNHNVMRHTYATMHAGAFRNPGATALNLGHGHSSAVLERYYMGVVPRETAYKHWQIWPKKKQE